MEFTPLLIIGAPRSGTNLVRDVLTSFPGIGTWPCDEINYIWRYGSPLARHDVRDAGDAVPRVAEFISNQFQKLAARENLAIVVEKTCANCLRIPFVSEVMPENAKYLHLIRDGRDAVSSALHRWQGDVELRYLLSKLRFVPKREVLYYGYRFLKERLTVSDSGAGLLPIWGPRVPGLQEMLRGGPLHLAVAHQWQMCVREAAAGLSSTPPGRVLEIRYEDFVQAPSRTLKYILDFLGRSEKPEAIAAAVVNVHAESTGRGNRDLPSRAYLEVEGFLQETLISLGYV